MEDEYLHEFADLSIHEQTREVKRNDRQIDLTPREYDLLLHLLRHPNQVLSREQLLNAVWGYDYFGDTNVVDVYIRYVRKKIETEGESTLIQTVRGVGYVLKSNLMKLKTKIHLFSTLLMLVILALTNIGIYFVFGKWLMTRNTTNFTLSQTRLQSPLVKVNENKIYGHGHWRIYAAKWCDSYL